MLQVVEQYAIDLKGLDLSVGKKCLARAVAVKLEGQMIGVLDNNQLLDEQRRERLDKAVSAMSKATITYGSEVRLIMAKKVVTEAMRRLTSAKTTGA